MPKLTVFRPDHGQVNGVYWPKSTAEAYLNDAKVDLGLTAYIPYAITLTFMIPDKKTTAYGQLVLKPEQAESLYEELGNILKTFAPGVIIKDNEEPI